MTNSGQFQKGQHWRPRQPWWDREWLDHEYTTLGRSAAEIGKDFGVGDTAIHFWLHKHGIPRRTVSDARKLKHWGASGSDNPMWNRKAELNPNWKGGASPIRQAFYASSEWKQVARSVWKRDKGTCQRCYVHKTKTSARYHIHHIVSFSNELLRASQENLIVLCTPCHRFVHSRKNINREFLPEGGVK